MLRHMGWNEAADLIVKGMDGAIAAKQVTYDFARLMDGATELKTSEFARRDDQQHVDDVRPQSSQSSQSRFGSASSASSVSSIVVRRLRDESKSDRGGRRRQRRRDRGPLHRRQGARRRRHRRHRRSEGGRHRARHARVVPDHRLGQPGDRRLRLRADRQLRRRRHHVGRAAQAGHEPRRPAERQLQHHEGGHRSRSSSTRPTASSCRWPTRSTRCARRSTG